MIKSPWVRIHELLTTGVHGVGSLYIPKAPEALTMRSFVKGWEQYKGIKGGGVDADPVALIMPPFDRNIIFDSFLTTDKWTVSVDGSGSRAADSIQWQQLATGATANSYCRFYTTTQIPNSGPGGSPNYIYFCLQNYSNTLTKPSTHLVRVGLIKFADLPWTADTKNAVGIKILDGDVYAVNGNGSNEKVTDTGLDIDSDWKMLRVLIAYKSTEIKFYIISSSIYGDMELAANLKATHTEYIGDLGNNASIYFAVENPESAANRSIVVEQVNFLPQGLS